MFYGNTVFIGNKQNGSRYYYLLRFIAFASGGYKTDLNLNIIATVSSISSVTNSPANAIKISAAILNLASKKLDSDKPEKITISFLSGCCL